MRRCLQSLEGRILPMVSACVSCVISPMRDQHMFSQRGQVPSVPVTLIEDQYLCYVAQTSQAKFQSGCWG